MSPRASKSARLPVGEIAALKTDSSVRVLVIEGDFLVRWGIAEYLRETGYEVVEAVSILEAKTILVADRKIDAVFCDTDLEPAGRSFPDWIEQNYPQLPLVCTSADSFSSAVCERSRFTRLSKPCTSMDIERSLAQLLEIQPV